MTQKKGALRLFVYEAEQKGGEFMKRKLSLVLALMMAAGLGCRAAAVRAAAHLQPSPAQRRAGSGSARAQAERGDTGIDTTGSLRCPECRYPDSGHAENIQGLSDSH